MHNKKWSRNIKKALSITMTSLMLLPSVVNAMPNESTYNFNEESFINSQLSISQIKEGVDITTEEEISVIVEFKEMPTAYATKVGKLSKTKSNSAIKKEHEDFEKFINELKLDSKKTYSADKNIKHNYTNTFNGVALNIKGTDVEKLLDCGVVKNIWPDNEVKVELPKEVETKGKQEIEPYMENSVPHLGVDKLHEEGIKGKGIKVGVIDTGIDYNHPDLKDNYKGGYDFVNKDNDPMETNLKDLEVSGNPEYHPVSGNSYYTSHGTHVAGTVAANGYNKESEFATVGIAPEADLYAYKVLGPYGSGKTADVLAGIEKAVEDGMDVINLSLGANTNDPLYPTSVACNNAMLAGVITVVANGNAGPNIGTVGAPAAAPLPISVGASSVDMKVQTFDVNGLGVSENGRLIGRDFDTKLETLNGENELVDCGLGKANDFKDKDVKGKIALIERGELSFNEKIINAKNEGAKSAIIYNNVDGPITVNLGENSQFIPTIGITKESGNKIKEALKNGEEAKINVNMGKVEVSKGDELADFSSRGPVINENIKPDVVAPGVSIFSTYPEFINDKDPNKEDYSKAYARINGTSMASPHVAGVAALIKSQNKDYDPFDVKVALMNTSDDLRHEYGVHEVGSGKIDPSQAIKSGISIRTEQEDKTISQDGETELIKHETASLSFGRATNIDKTIKMEKELLIDNSTNKTNTFDVSVDYITPNKTNNVKDAEKNKVKLNVKETATANRNSETKLKTTLTIPKNAEFGVYQGYVKLQNKKSKDEVYQMPFSVNYTKAGIESAVLTRNAISNDVDWFNPFLENGIHMQLTMNQYVEKIDFIVRDFETQEVIGYIGSLDGGQFTPGVEKGIRGVLNGNGTVYPIDKDGNVSQDLLKLKDGKYSIELRAVDSDNKVFIEQVPFIVDTDPAKWEVDKPGGVYELKEDDFTVEEYEGQQQEAFWIHGKVDDESIEILNSMGVKASKSDINVVSYLDGMIGPKFNVDEDGNYKLGIEKNDIERPNDHLELTTMPLDEATALNPDGGERYFFMKEGTPYVYSKLDKKEMVEKDMITTTLSFNNVKNASNFKTQLQYVRGFKIKDVKLNDEGVKILEKEGYEAILSHKDESSTLRPKESFNIDIKDKEGNAVEYSGDIDLVDVVFELEDDRNLDTYKGYFFCKESSIYNKNGEEQDLSTRLVYDMVDVPQNSSRGIMADPIEGTADINKKPEENLKYIWVEDNEGKKYDFEYDSSWSKYISKDLPISDKEYTIVTQAPGHFRREEQFIPSRNIAGKLIGKDSIIGFNINALAGDADGNSAIDIHDAMSLADDYGKSISNDGMKNKDFNADGKIDEKDMDYVVKNFMKVNSQDKNAATPEKESNGKTLDDILKEIGYK